jgi:heme-degrading monooxygenase HmoA
MPTKGSSHRAYRVNKFAVPASARSQFLDRVHESLDVLRTLPGFVQNLVLEQTDGPGRFNIVTFVTWEDSAAITNAEAVMEAERARSGSDSQALIARLGIEADQGTYAEIPV